MDLHQIEPQAPLLVVFLRQKWLKVTLSRYEPPQLETRLSKPERRSLLPFFAMIKNESMG